MEQKDKELYYKLITDCESLIECPNEKAGKRVLACEYCRFEYLRKAIAKDIFTELLKDENIEVATFLDGFGEVYDDTLVRADKIRELAERHGVEVEE